MNYYEDYCYGLCTYWLNASRSWHGHALLGMEY